MFQVAVREDALAGGVTVSYKGRTVVASADQPMASVNGRVVTLPAPVARVGRGLFVPIDFLPRALAPIYDAPIELRRAPRMLVGGNVRVVRVVPRIEAVGPPTRVTIEMTPAALVSVAADAGRVLLRVDADALEVGPTPPGTGLIDQIRTGDQSTTVAIALSPRAGMARVSTTTTADNTRVLLEVPLLPQLQDTNAAPAPPAPAPPPSSAAPTADVLLPPAGPRLRTMVIDPGHGGDDVGVRGPKGTVEKQITLDVARRLKTLVETRLGVRVVMTRDDDRAVTPDERDAVANNSKADLFLSIHVNGAVAPSVAGAEVYYLRLDREGEDARRNAAATELVLPAVGGGTRPIDMIRWELAQSFHVGASATFASMIEEEFRKHIPMGPRALQQEPMRVLAGANMPASLVEIAYLTNPDQEQLAQSGDYQTNVAQALYDAVLRFRSYSEAAPGQRRGRGTSRSET